MISGEEWPLGHVQRWVAVGTQRCGKAVLRWVRAVYQYVRSTSTVHVRHTVLSRAEFERHSLSLF